MNKPLATLAVVLLILIFIIILQNTQVMSMKVLFWEVSMSRIIFLPLVMLIGFFIGFIVGRKSWDWE